LKQRELLEKTPVIFQKELKRKYEEQLYLNLFIKKELQHVLDEFDSRGIPVIPLKGIIFAEKYFGHIGARPTSDIDILIKQEDLEMAIQLVKSLGFTMEAEPISSHFHCSFSRFIPGLNIPLTVEIHWNILKENTSNLSIQEFWIRATPMKNYQHVWELTDRDTFYMICLHGWRHNLDSLKYFIDIVQLIHHMRCSLNLEELFKEAEKDQTLKRMRRTLTIVYKLFPHLQSFAPFPKRRFTILWKYDVNIGKNKNLFMYIDFLDYQFFSYDTFKHSASEMRAWFLSFKPFQIKQKRSG
jgi:hypothetical protein